MLKKTDLQTEITSHTGKRKEISIPTWVVH